MTDLRVLMKPSILDFQSSQSEGGIRRVVEAYTKHLPQFGVEVVGNTTDSYDLIAAHAGAAGGDCDVSHCHGLLWSADYECSAEEYKTNARVIESLRTARAVTVPSNWVAHNIARDMRFRPYVVPHGIDWEAWQHQEENQGFVLWNKTRTTDACDPKGAAILARAFPKLQFVSTFPLGDLSNVKVTGVLPHGNMKRVIQRCGVYLSTVKETGAIGVMEAMAAGRPVLGWRYGANVDVVRHGITGYLAEPDNEEDLIQGLLYCLEHGRALGDNGREVAQEYTWEKACNLLSQVYRVAHEKVRAADSESVSCIIPCHNYGTKVGRAIESVLSQTVPVKEIIVVSDDSSDNSREVIGSYATRYPTVHLEEVGFRNVAHTRNRGR